MNALQMEGRDWGNWRGFLALVLIAMLGVGCARRGPGSSPHGRSGRFVINYSQGRLTSVRVAKSTGDAALDRRTVHWIAAYFKVKPGASGSGLLPVTWKLDGEKATPPMIGN